eukprot:GEZU01004272.1.p1 GENE.GEZU01004272.1~~GEZU01004272.1.p1  ORF type:complete len:214 (-),score=39.06 GEZU01004272.1:39-680(-)
MLPIRYSKAPRWHFGCPYDAEVIINTDTSITTPKLHSDRIAGISNNNLNLNLISLIALTFGIFDTLVLCNSDDLAKQDSNVEVISMKFLRQWEDVTIEKKDWYPTVDITDSRTGQVTSVPVQSYLKEFKWDESQYSMTKSLRELAEMAYQKASKFDEELKAKISEYTNLKTQLSAVQRKDKGSLTSRTLAGLVEPKHVVESEYLTTLFVVVPK